MKAQGIDRLIALLSKDSTGQIENVTRAGNSEDMISIAFTDGEVLVLTVETEVSEDTDDLA